MNHRDPAAPSDPPTADQRGFVLGLVVLFLFAIAVGATAGYQMVNTEFALAQGTRDGQKALVVARAGLERYMADQIGDVVDSVRYAIADGDATITARLVYQQDADNHLYYIESEGTVADARTPDDPARRVVGTYAWHRLAPFPHVAAIFITDRSLRFLGEGTEADGYDTSTSMECVGGGTTGVYGVATGGTVTTKDKAVVQGYPAGTDESYTGYDDVIASMQVRWDILTDPEFPVDFDGSPPPDWSAIPADSFPVSRTDAGLNEDETGGWSGGHGLLIVRDSFRPRGGFNWKGIVLAGRLAWTDPGDTLRVDGMVFAGFNTYQQDEDIAGGVFQYNYCQARGANEAASYLERLDHAVYEVNEEQ